ncbi:hypothetical protein GCM10008966_11360 [Rhodovulum strictum]
MRQIIRRNVTRDTGLVGEEDPAPDLAIVCHAVLTGEARSVRQPDYDSVVETRAFAKLQEIIWPGTFYDGTSTGRASGSDQEGEESRKMSTHYPS